jgi:phage portal protein BeeE
VHWAPIPDPQADFRGMSWLTPVYRDIQGDNGMTQYKIAYLEHAASPNMLIRYTQKLNPGTVDAIRERVAARYAGPQNAFRTLVLDQGADATVIGNSLTQMDFTNVAQAGVERVLAAAMVPGVMLGFEPLRGAGRSFADVVRHFADAWARPQWRSACGALQQLVPGPDLDAGAARLWFSTDEIAALQDGELQRSQATLVRAQAILALNQAQAYDPKSIVDAVEAADLDQLEVAPQPAALPGQPVQHMLGQTPPGITADPLPPANPRIPVGSTSPGDGGNGTRPTPRPTSARRFNGN